MNQNAPSSEHLVWLADHFYWALLDAALLPSKPWRSQHDPQRLGYLFEAELPLPIEEVQAVYLPLGGSHYLACGVEHARLSEEAAAQATTLRPEGVPEALLGEFVENLNVESINLLIDRHEPAPVRRERRRFVREAVLLTGLALVLIGVGITRRSHSLDLAAAEMASARTNIYERLYPPDASPPSNQPHSVRLLAELRQLQQTRSGATPQELHEPESAQSLRVLLAQLPRDLPIRTESISITPTSMTLTGMLPSTEQAQAFASAFAPPTGWDAKQPQVDSVADGVRLTLRLTRHNQPKHESAAAHQGIGS